MELVYLWVEEYKNIKRQGFNFSPNYECEFKSVYEDDELTDESELIINPKDNSLKSFFGDNINISAVIGENGSGKSSLIELINEIFYIEYQKTRNIVAGDEHMVNFIIAFEVNNKIYKLNNFNNSYKNEFNVPLVEKISTYIYSSDNVKKSLYNKISLSDKEISRKLVFDYSNHNIDSFKLTSFMYLPDQVTIRRKDLNEIYKKLIEDDKLYPFYRHEPDWVYLQRISEEKDNSIRRFESLTDEYEKFLEILDLKNLKFKLKKKEFEFYFQSFNSEFKNTKMIKTIELKEEEKDIYFNKYVDFFEFDFIDKKGRNFNSLSHGEKVLFSQFLSIYYYSNIIKNENICFLLDEPEISLHPNWQKQYIKELSNLLKNLNKKIQVLLASHSPFLLSDIPKKNIVFLNKYIQKDKEVIQGLQDVGCCKLVNNVSIKETFGANIHTLLSNGFFMKDGLMGEFSKSKIDEVIKFLNSEDELITLKEKDLKSFIDLIGEDFIKSKLLNMYYKKYKKEERKKELEKLKADIEKELEQYD